MSVVELSPADLFRGRFLRLRTEETAAGLLAAEHLRRLRLTNAHRLLAKSGHAALVRDAIPSLDSGSLRALGRIIDVLRPSLVAGEFTLEQLAPFGLTRLALIAEAPAAQRADMVAVGPLPITEMRRWTRDGVERAEASALRASLADPNLERLATEGRELLDTSVEALIEAPAAARLETDRAGLALARRYWIDASVAMWDQGRALLDIGEAEGQRWLPLIEVDASERRRLVIAPTRWPAVTSLRAADAGVAALRVVAERAADGHPEAEAAGAGLLDGSIDAEAAILMVRRSPAAGRTEAAASEAPAVAAMRDDPARIAVQNLFFAERGPGPQYLDSLPPALLEQLILRCTRPGGHVWDPTAGAGATLRAAEAVGRSAEVSDILDPPVDPAVGVADARTAKPSLTPQLVILHPPLPFDGIYSERYGSRRLAADLSGMGPDGYGPALQQMVENVAAAIPPGGWLALVLREGRWDGQFRDWPVAGTALVHAAGLTIVDRMYAPMPIEERAERFARGGLRARDRGELLPVVWSVILARRDTRRAEGR